MKLQNKKQQQPPKSFVVKGRVVQSDGRPVPGCIVNLSDHDQIGQPKRLSRKAGVITDGHGRFEIQYATDQLARPGKTTANLEFGLSMAKGKPVKSFQLYQLSGEERTSVENPQIIFKAKDEETVEIVLGEADYPRLSEYEQLVADLTPLLRNVPFEKLPEDTTHRDIAFLSKETGHALQHIAFLGSAHRLMKETKLPADAIYGLLRQNLTADLSTLLAQSPDVRKRALEEAARSKIVPSRLGRKKEINKVLAELKRLVVDQAVEKSTEPGKYSLGELLTSVIPDDKKRREFLSAYLSRSGPEAKFWQKMRKKPGFRKQVKDLEFTLQLGSLTANHLPLVEHIQELRRSRRIQVAGMRDLAQFDEAWWKSQITDQKIPVPPDVDGSNANQKIAKYASTISRKVENAFPTDYVGHRIKAENRRGEAYLRKFFDRNVFRRREEDKFDLRTTYPERYMKDHPDAMAGVPDKEEEGLLHQLKALQRVAKVAPRYDVMRPLFDNGIHSAQSIVRLGDGLFIQKYSNILGDQALARDVYNTAAQITAVALTHFAEYSGQLSSLTISVLPGTLEEVDEIPNWAELFGSPDLCECEHCKSVYSPAAYLVDVLHFLDDRKLLTLTQKADGSTSIAIDNNKSAKDVLYERRPDLGEIELTCENTNTPLPYVDLVNEVLEGAVSPFPPFKPFDLPASFLLFKTRRTRNLVNELNQFRVPNVIRDLLRKAGHELDSPSVWPSVSRTKPRTYSWTIYENRRGRFLIQEVGDVLHLTQVFIDWVSELNNRSITTWRAIFSPSLSEHATISVKRPGTSWIIDEPAFTYSIRKEGRNLRVISRSRQTKGTAAELSANPQYLHPSAYNTLRSALYPWELPFDLWAEEARIYLDHLGVSRSALMESFASNLWSDVLKDHLVAIELLGMTKEQAEIITGGVSRAPWELWGFSSENVAVPDPVDNSLTLRGKWYEVVSRVGIILGRSGLDDGRREDRGFKDLLEILDTKYINPVPPSQLLGYGVRIESSNGADPATCGLNELLIKVSVTTQIPTGRELKSTWGKILRFIRLSRALGWKYTELDQAIWTLGDFDIDSDLLVKLSHVQRLRRALKVSIPTILSWWGPLNTVRYKDHRSAGRPEIPSLYDSLFLNKAIITPLDQAFELNAGLDELKRPSTPAKKFSISQHRAVVVAALGISESDLSLLLNEGKIPDELNLANLSALYRQSSLAKALRLTIADFLRAINLTGIDPFDVTDTVQTLLFVEKIEKIRSARFTIEELNYLLRNEFRPPSPIAPGDDEIALVLEEFRAGLRKIAEEYAFTPGTTDPEGELTRKKLVILQLPENAIDQVMDLLKSTPSDLRGRLGESRDLIDAQVIVFPDATDAKEKLVGTRDIPPTLTNPEQRFLYVLEPLMKYLRRTLSESFVKQKLGEALKIETESADKLLTNWVDSPGDPTKKALGEFLDPSFAESDPDVEVTAAAPFSNLFKTFTLLHKIALMIRKLRLTSRQLGWVFGYGTQAGWLELNALPLAIPGATSLDKWEKLVDFLRARTNLPLNESVLDELLKIAFRDAPTDADKDAAKRAFLETLSNWTEWSEKDLAVLAGQFDDYTDPGFLNLSFPDAYRDGQLLHRLKDCFALLKRLGVAAETCHGWVGGGIDEGKARQIKQAAKAKYDDAKWLALAKPLRDVLREKQRAALVAYLIANPVPSRNQYWQDANDLYAHFLIDVEMDPCQMTSRIKQAISSTQLFVQRCLMGLEKGVIADAEIDSAWRWWKWMKAYRIWEANRKVFLYPENWIEPELRDDKSPFFKELEGELMQNDLTPETAETAFLHYLEKLDQVAQLEIDGLYHQFETLDGTKNSDVSEDVLHVFGRTRHPPHVYFYRKWIDQSYWTPWERIHLNIEGNYLIPAVWNRRLYLFWPIFTEQASEQTIKLDMGSDVETPEKYWEIQIAWGEYSNGKWLPQNTSTGRLKTISATGSGFSGFFDSYHSKELFYFNVELVNDQLLLRGSTGDRLLYFVNIGHWLITDPHGRINVNDNWLRFDYPADFFPIEGNRRPYEHATSFSLAVSELDDSRMPIEGKVKRFSVLNRSMGHFMSIFPNQYVIPSTNPSGDSVGKFSPFVCQAPCFFQDDTRTFVINLTVRWPPNPILVDPLEIFRFQTFYHPYVTRFIRTLNHEGVDGLLRRAVQLESNEFFENYRWPTQYVAKGDPVRKEKYPKDEVDFSFGGSYAQYNWELFFHIPLFIADRLSKNQRFEEAIQWFHYIFDPTDPSREPVPQRFWQTRPFYENAARFKDDRIALLLKKLAEGDTELENQVRQWRDDPFKPHLIARMRTAAYPKTVVMKYIDTLIAWGDQLFRRDTIESLNEATQLYILAAEILGPRPASIPPRAEPAVHTYDTLAPHLDAFSNALVQIENLLPALAGGTLSSPLERPLPLPTMLYFCVPQNDRLVGYWDIVADRLFKIRHCMNIEGIVRQLPLFEPPIDPALLVKAAAAGIDLSSALNDINAALPHYRFTVMMQKATELCAEVKALGGALLSALEKRDAEALALLRSTHELTLLNAVRQVKQQQVDEARESLEGVKRNEELVKHRQNRYTRFAKDSLSASLSGSEKAHLNLVEGTIPLQGVAAQMNYMGNMLSAIPEGTIGPFSVGVRYGGLHLGQAVTAMGNHMNSMASIMSTGASMRATLAGYERRRDDWVLQAELADKELKQIEKQKLAAEIRHAVAERELANHDLQIENAQEVDAYMRDKFTNRDLYDWMVGQISSIYFQSYQLAYDVAKRAERAYRHELGLSSSNFIQFGYWDSLKKGLLAGERLYHDLKRMDVAYLDQNRREYEISKHISLQQLDPVALVELKQTGRCFINVPEALFDLDYPGHFMRRIKSVSMSMPCIVGPYSSVNCTLTLESSKTRTSPVVDGKYAEEPVDSDPRFSYSFGAVQSIVTSGAQNDSGLFEFNFRDERYLPFEGSGVISKWHLELPDAYRQFDYNTISDVILHFRYTAREGGGLLKEQVRAEQEEAINTILLAEGRQGLARLFSARHEFPDRWHLFLHPASVTDNQTLKLPLNKDRFPFIFQRKDIAINKIELYVMVKPEFADTHNEATLKLTLAAGENAPTSDSAGARDVLSLTSFPEVKGLLQTEKSIAGQSGDWTMNAWLDAGDPLDPNALEDIFIICHYSIAQP